MLLIRIAAGGSAERRARSAVGAVFDRLFYFIDHPLVSVV
jgi:hypothetical protein